MRWAVDLFNSMRITDDKTELQLLCQWSKDVIINISEELIRATQL